MVNLTLVKVIDCLETKVSNISSFVRTICSLIDVVVVKLQTIVMQRCASINTLLFMKTIQRVLLLFFIGMTQVFII